ncbi:cytochrome P450 monooxygenase pc-3 [Punctularia strigosozonata HHB-11173 SS5]|uniref:Cytochrome P450 monooxygenase pc-3 n=1 Tax=Punctularia strigosozonata (strain HHB-11173) TaxID=741275 RepID=R7S373_PUNST|nr:cytochrome P450 monooxygenase pc-3 [Punctularia strigosozonata HHB-11173 SS5]EIN04294.1 cytochrome P450 monooxygenase pc-3 [Punctularia strigosozonata HHB-11173 SS5]
MPSLSISPGIAALLRSIPSFVTPFVLLFSLKRVLDARGSSAPAWAYATACVLGYPLVFFGRVFYKDWRIRRRAHALGARPVPRVSARLPGGIDRLMYSIQHMGDYCGDAIRPMYTEAGPLFDMRVLWNSAFFTAHPAHIKSMLATDFQNFVKGPLFTSQMRSVLGAGVFNADGDVWRFHRGITRPFFVREKITHFEMYESHAREAIDRLRERVREGVAVDVQDLVARFTLDSATVFLFGQRVHSLGAPLPYPHNHRNGAAAAGQSASAREAEAFARAFGASQDVLAQRATVGPIWPLFEMKRDGTAEPMRIVNAFIDPILKEAMRKRPAGEVRSGEGKEEVADEDTLLDYLVRQTSDTTLIKDEILNIMIAGRDTTATTLTSALYALAIHPPVFARLRSEIAQHVGLGRDGRAPTYDDVRAMKYLRAVINEVLRLFPPVPFNVRTSVGEVVWPADSGDVDGRGWYVPPGTSCTYSVLYMHRRKDLWGPDAEEFDPDRFLDERLHKYLTPNPFIFLPFNAGPRICLGQQFAYNEASFMLIRLLQVFSGIELAPDAQPPDSRPPPEWKQLSGRTAIEQFWPRNHLTMYAKGGLWVRLTETEG